MDYIITTSGTSGTPKPVYVTSSSIKPNIVDIQNEFQLQTSDVIFLSSPFTFDPSLIDIFVSLLSGCVLVAVPSLHKLKYSANLVSHLSITVLQCTPSLFKLLLSSKKHMASSELRIVAVGGEQCSVSIRDTLKDLMINGVKVYHLYGLTEISVWQSLIKVFSKYYFVS